MAELAAWTIVTLLAALSAFQVALALGAPLGHYAWGGQHRVLPGRLRLGSLFSVATYVLMALVMLARVGVLTTALPAGFLRAATWVLAAYFLVGIGLNAASRSRGERLVMTPVVTVLCALTVVVALA
jgi:hypothetical protein